MSWHMCASACVPAQVSQSSLCTSACILAFYLAWHISAGPQFAPVYVKWLTLYSGTCKLPCSLRWAVCTGMVSESDTEFKFFMAIPSYNSQLGVYGIIPWSMARADKKWERHSGTSVLMMVFSRYAYPAVNKLRWSRTRRCI